MLKELECQTTSEREVKIVEVDTAIENQKPVKTNAGYTYKVTYTLEDGRKIQSRNSKRLLRDAKQALEHMPYHPKGMLAKFSAEGEFWGTSQTFSLFE